MPRKKIDKCCNEILDINHMISHIEISLMESDLFEEGLNKIIDKTAKKLRITKDAALSIVLEQVRDEMRKRGFENFSFERENIVQSDSDE